jgi:hypothetical protein
MQFGVYAKGYRHAARIVAEKLIEQGRFPDYDAYPIVFLYRHAFELHLKNVIYCTALLAAFKRMDDIDTNLYNNHDLCTISDSATKVLCKAFPNDSGIAELSSEIIDTAKDLSILDKSSFSYRYPIDKKGKPSTKRSQLVDAEAFANHMENMLEKLEVVDFGIDLETERAQELYELMEVIWPSNDT